MPSLLYHLTPCAILFFVARNVLHRVTYPEIIPASTPDNYEKTVTRTILFDRSNATSSSSSSSTATLDPSMFLQDGYYWPPNKRARTDPSQHAIIIPYRERPYHLEKFLEYMNPYLQRHFPDSTFSLWIVEQDDDKLFNRAWLANVGLNEIIKHAPQTKCVIMHDVDLVPNQTDVMVPYTTCTYPTQLGRALQNWKWKIPYPTYCGGITSLSLKHWQTVNGMSNDYIGWGGEDDDLYHRMRINGLLNQPNIPGVIYAPLPRRPRRENGAFRAISQSEEHHTQNKKHQSKGAIYSLLSLMYQNSGRWKHDGLNDAYYTVTKRTVHRNSTAGFKEVHHVWSIPEKSWSTGDSGDNTQQPILELVPIPYTGANDVLTTTAARAGIVWGACHYLDPSQSAQAQTLECPKKGSGDFIRSARFDATYQQAQEPWHLPPMAFADALYGKNPLEGTHRFTVVRNPYQRALGLYRGWNEPFHQDREITDPERLKKIRQVEATRLNSFLQSIFRNGQTDLLLPQTYYILVEGAQYTQHVLRYEHLIEDLGAVTQQYEHLANALDWNSLDARMQQQANTANSNATESRQLGVEDLTDETIAVLNRWFKEDFNRLEYEPKAVNDQSLIAQAKPKTKDPSHIVPLQFVDNPYTGGEVLTKAASRAGVVWGACHFTSSKDLCPLTQKRRNQQQGDLASTWKFRADPHQAQKPWLLPPTLFIPKLFKGNKTFAIVRNPYDRAIDFYRDIYNQQERRLQRNNSTTDWAHRREDPKKLNTFLQNALVRFHRPHHEDPASIPPLQSGYAKTADHVIRYESWRRDLEDLLTKYDMTNILKELPSEDSPLLAPELAAMAGHWLQASDLNEITIDMLNRRYGVDFQHWYREEKVPVNVTTKSDQYWRLSQTIPEVLVKGKDKHGRIKMSGVKKMIFLNSTEVMEKLLETNPTLAKKVFYTALKKKKGVPVRKKKKTTTKKGTKKTTKKGTSTTKKKAKTRWGKAQGTKTTKKGTSAATARKKGKPTTRKTVTSAATARKKGEPATRKTVTTKTKTTGNKKEEKSTIKKALTTMTKDNGKEDKEISPRDSNKQENDSLEFKVDKNPGLGDKEGHGHDDKAEKANSQRESDIKDEAVEGTVANKDTTQEVKSTGTEVTARTKSTTTTNEEEEGKTREAVIAMTKTTDDKDAEKGQLNDQDDSIANNRRDNGKQDKSF